MLAFETPEVRPRQAGRLSACTRAGSFCIYLFDFFRPSCDCKFS